MSSSTSADTKLEARALAQFDSLREKHEVYWEHKDEIKFEQKPFDVHFLISPITQVKPFNPEDKSRKPGFLDDDPEFTLSKIAPNHKLILNKYCWLRPQMILHTLDFQSQRDMLAEADFEASVNVLSQLGDQYMVIFNGGPDAGSSVAHKHLQVFLRPKWKTIADEIAADPQVLPFEYRLVTLQHPITPKEHYNHYLKLCEQCSIHSGRGHNLLLVKEWMMVIPRSCATVHGEIADAPLQGGANAMIGMLWLKSEAQYRNWQEYGPMRALQEFGVSPQGSP